MSLVVDPIRIEQILVNLLTNAAKYTEPGGVIGLTAEVQGNDLAITVGDNGIGISARDAGSGVRPLRAGRPGHRSRPRRAGHRPLTVTPAGSNARRRAHGPERWTGARQPLHTPHSSLGSAGFPDVTTRFLSVAQAPSAAARSSKRSGCATTPGTRAASSAASRARTCRP